MAAKEDVVRFTDPKVPLVQPTVGRSPPLAPRRLVRPTENATKSLPQQGLKVCGDNLRACSEVMGNRRLSPDCL